MGPNLQELGIASAKFIQLVDDFRAKRIGFQVSLTDWSVITVFATIPSGSVPTIQRSDVMSSATLQGYYESHPLITRVLLRRVARQASPAEQATIQNMILATAGGMGAAGQVLDDLSATNNTAKLGDGTLLKLLLDNLPAIINAILEIIKAMGLGGATTHSNIQVAPSNTASHGQTDFAVPPGLIMVLEQAVTLLWPLIEKKIDEYIGSGFGK